MTSHGPLGRLLDVPRVDNDDERRAIWRQGLATLARIALEQQPVPLEGLDPLALLETVRSAFQFDLLQDLSWLSPPGAAAAVYELASAIPVGPERRKLGREVLTRLYEGDAETFVVLATSLAAESKRTLTGIPIRARLALALSLPLGSGVHADALALALLTRADLRREWLIEPASGSLTSRHLAARLLERAARDCARRAAQGDTGALRAFQDPAIKASWQLLLADRESLVWRHVATARGLLCKALPDFAEEIETQQNPALSPTEWRRAAVSLGASVAIDPHDGYQRCRALLANEKLRSDTGLVETMIFGLARAAEVEPEIAEDLLEQIVRLGGIEAAEALVELRRERVAPTFGVRSARIARDKLRKWVSTHSQEDDGRTALCEALIEELTDDDATPHSLHDELDHARALFVERSARHAYTEAWRVWESAKQKLLEIEHSNDTTREARKRGFRLLRELDEALLQTAALTDLLSVGAANTQTTITESVNELFERLTTWLLRVEATPVLESGAVDNLAMRLRRMRTLLHLVDADGQYGEDNSGQRRLRRLRALEVLLARVKHDATSPLRRIVCATLARALDASMRDDVCELSDALVAVADHVMQAHDIATLAEASMLEDFQRSLVAYAQLMRFCERAEPTGRHARFGIDALRELGQSLPWANTLRVSALRGHLLTVARRLEEIAAARSLTELAEGAGRDRVSALDSSVTALCRLVRGARRRLSGRTTMTMRDGGTLEALALALERADKEGIDPLRRALVAAHKSLFTELPGPIAKTIMLVLQRLEQLPLRAEPSNERRSTSFAPSVPKEAPLPGWLTGRRTLGGFYVLHPLGTGGVGSVFVVKRVEERHREDAIRFALKVPDYSAEAARTLSEEQFLQLFQQEAGALMALPRHANIAGFVTFDAGARPKPILVMELVEGPTLERVLERGDLDVSGALTLLEGVGAGLEAMHRVGIGHLDLKPSNVILRSQQRPNGEVVTPVLVDFGLAGRHLRPGCGTGLYGAPEIWGLIPTDHEPKPATADVYAFACLAFEVLTGEPLFDEDNELAVINAHLSHDGYPSRLRNLAGAGGRQELCELLANGLRRHPAERVNIAEMRDGLRELAPALRKHAWPLRAA
ncbi:MAG TPA: serine/threonine-protein kinase [Polyangiales bacterium]|nr:serine/threonine-protein kinase [Polyangiales bacterium]